MPPKPETPKNESNLPPKPEKPKKGSRFRSISDRLKKTLSLKDKEANAKSRIRKPESPVSPLTAGDSGSSGTSTATATSTCSSATSSGSMSGQTSGSTSSATMSGQTSGTTSSATMSGQASGSTSSDAKPPPKKPDPKPRRHSDGERSAKTSSSGTRIPKPGQSRSTSAGTHKPVSSGFRSRPVEPPPPRIPLPIGNICPSGIVKTGMASKPRPTVLGTGGGGHYGMGNIIQGGGSGGPVKKPLNPAHIEVEELMRRGTDYYKRSNFRDALILYDKAIAVLPENPICHYNRSGALLGLNQVAEAAKECAEAITIDPSYSHARHRLGSLFLSLGSIVNARAHLCGHGVEADPLELYRLARVEKHVMKCTDFRKNYDWEGVLREVDGAIASGANASPELWACKAEATLKLHRLGDANAALSTISIWPPEMVPHAKPEIFGMQLDAYTFFVKAQVESANGRFDGAIMAIEKAAVMHTTNKEIIALLRHMRLLSRSRTRGNDLFKSDKFPEAIAVYEEGLKLDPTNAVLYCNRAACWFRLGEWQKSVDDCNQTLRIIPSYKKAVLRRGASYYKLENWSEAVRDYEVLRREYPYSKEVAVSLFHSKVALRKSRGEDVSKIKFGVGVEAVYSLVQFRNAVAAHGVSLVHYKTESNEECAKISGFLTRMFPKFKSVKFLEVDIEKNPDIARKENVKTVPSFKIYRKGAAVKEILAPTPDILLSLVRYYSHMGN